MEESCILHVAVVKLILMPGEYSEVDLDGSEPMISEAEEVVASVPSTRWRSGVGPLAGAGEPEGCTVDKNIQEVM